MTGVFKTYDIRGKYPDEINENLFFNIGTHIRKVGIRSLAVGRDARLSSPALHKAFIKGLLVSGTKVIDLGKLTSPMLSYFCATKKHHGAMITASHNPPVYNGLKFIDQEGVQLGYGVFLRHFEAVMHKAANPAKKKGKVIVKDISPDYCHHLYSLFHKTITHPVRAVIDCSNGVGGIPLDVIGRLKVNATIINKQPDGHFPNHLSDQTVPENLKELQKAVIKNKAEIGVMFDGDSDRCTFVDERGEIVPMDMAFLLLALYEMFHTHLSRPKILFDLRFSKVVKETLHAAGAIPVIMRVGNPFYKRAIHADSQAILGGELSGHIMFKENHAIDDPLFAALKMFSLISQSTLPLSHLIIAYKKYFSSGEFSLVVRFPSHITQAMEKKYASAHFSYLDGISVNRGEVWFNARISRTEPLMRFVIEGINPDIVEKQKEEILSLIHTYDHN